MARRITLQMSPLVRREPMAGEMYFPLTLALSLGEREQAPPGVGTAYTSLTNSVACMAETRSCFVRLVHFCGWTILLNQ
jgi:hypothetical protein